MPLYIETHRATITQDIWRTVEMTKRHPEIHFNGDFSHWYTGLEMPYGDITAKFDFCEPVFERVRFFHGRIGDPSCMQVDVGDGTGLTYVDHFREMWTRSCIGFLRSAKPGDYISFAPELLHPSIYYGRLMPDGKGGFTEYSDRWQQAGAGAHRQGRLRRRGQPPRFQPERPRPDHPAATRLRAQVEVPASGPSLLDR